MIRRLALMFGIMTALAGPSFAVGQGPPDPAALLASQTEAMSRFAFMDGEWSGTAWTLLPSGAKHELTQTERVGLFLEGSVRLIEGRGFESDGRLSFNAFAVISYDPATRAYSMRSYARGQVGDFALTPTGDGFSWEIMAGPATIHYTAVIKDGDWKEVGMRIVPGQEPVQIFEANLRRIGDTDWPNAGAVPRRPRS